MHLRKVPMSTSADTLWVTQTRAGQGAFTNLLRTEHSLFRTQCTVTPPPPRSCPCSHLLTVAAGRWCVQEPPQCWAPPPPAPCAPVCPQPYSHHSGPTAAPACQCHLGVVGVLGGGGQREAEGSRGGRGKGGGAGCQHIASVDSSRVVLGDGGQSYLTPAAAHT